MRTAVWLDCDPGHDDAMAMILAGHSDKVQLLGLSTIGGNQSVHKTTANALKVATISGLEDIDVVRGSDTFLCRNSKDTCEEIHGESGLEGTEFPPVTKSALDVNCFLHIRDTVLKQTSKVVLVATGSLTNYAILLKAFPEVKANVSRIVLLGGAIRAGNMTPAAEWNILLDPEAASIVFESGLEVVMVPMEVTHHVLVTPDVVARIQELNSPFAKVVVDLLLFFASTYKNYFFFDYPPLHDPCAIAYVIKPELFKCELMRVDIERKSEFCDGRTVCDIYHKSTKPKNALVARSVDLAQFWDLMLDALRKANAVSILNRR